MYTDYNSALDAMHHPSSLDAAAATAKPLLVLFLLTCPHRQSKGNIRQDGQWLWPEIDENIPFMQTAPRYQCRSSCSNSTQNKKKMVLNQLLAGYIIPVRHTDSCSLTRDPHIRTCLCQEPAEMDLHCFASNQWLFHFAVHCR